MDTQVFYVHRWTTDDEMLSALEESDIVLVGQGVDAENADRLSTKYCVKCLLVFPVLPEGYKTLRTSAPRIVVTDEPAVAAIFKGYAEVIDELGFDTLDQLINTEVL